MIQLKNVTLRRSAKVLLDAASVTLNPGEKVALVGHSGSGKSTLARLLYRFYDPSAGRILVDGQALTDVTQDSVRQHIAVVPQDTVLFNDSIFANVAYANPDAPEQAVFDAMTMAQLDQFVSRLPDKERTLVGERGLKLSGGEKQRVAIARALFSQPELLLMDEPLASLDTQRKREILPYLEKLRLELKIPIVYVTHSIDELSRLADWVVVLDQGRVVANGSLTDVLTALDSPMQLDDAGVVLETTIRSREAQWALMRVSFIGGELLLADNGRAEGETLRVRVDARDVSLTLSQHTDTSILNALPATVIEISACLSQDAVLVKLGLGHQSIAALDESKAMDEQSKASRDSNEMLLSRITRRSAEHLALAVGSQVWAQIKSVAVLR